jgi:two-component system cell cycle response regulator
VSKRPDETTQIIQIKQGPAGKPGAAMQATLTVLTGANPGAVYKLETPNTVIGRSADVGVPINDRGLSRRHAQVLRLPDGFYLEDLGSTNGTFYNGERIGAARKLESGCRIQIGENTVLRFSLQDELEQEAAAQVYEMTVRDPLTRLHNRRYLDERLQTEFAFAARHRTTLSVLILDVDHFKRVNDTMGHQAGDAVLRGLASALQRMVRTEDLLARYGGEEFVVAARGIDERSAGIFAERIRRNVEQLEIPWADSRLKITISIVLAHMGERRFPAADALVAAADGALYQAKKGGRNRVVKA